MEGAKRINSFVKDYKAKMKEAAKKAIPPAILAPILTAIPFLVGPATHLVHSLTKENPESLTPLALVSFAVMTIGDYLTQFYTLKKRDYNASLASTVMAQFIDTRLAIASSMALGFFVDPNNTTALVGLLIGDPRIPLDVLTAKSIVGGMIGMTLNLGLYYIPDRISRLAKKTHPKH